MTYEEASARWVQRHFRGLDPNPLLGSVEFLPKLDDSEDTIGILVLWHEDHEFPGPYIRVGAGRQLTMRKRVVYKERLVTDIELTDIIREIVKLATEA